jgi:hypothetical protein
MDQNPLVSELIEVGARFLKEFDKSYPVAVAFWLKSEDESRWHLHIASEKNRDGNARDAYGAVLRIAAQMKDVSFDPFYVRLCGMDESIVQFALDYRRRYPGRMAAVSNVPSFFGVEVEGMYLYPPAKTVAA